MRIIVTGGAGFIGSWLCEKLVNKGHDVVCVDNFLSGRKSNISHIKNIKIIKHDVTEPLKIKGKIDMIFHLASLASPKFYKEMPIETMLANSFGTQKMIELARQKKSRIIYASTSEVYGDPLEHPQRESYYGNVNILGERSCYDESKRFGETLVYTMCRKYGMSYCIARIFNTYGPRMRRDDGRVIPNFISQALSGKPITIYGDGKQTRSFCYVEDTVEGIIEAAFSPHKDVFNIGNPDEITVLELADKIKKITNSRSKISFEKIGMNDPCRRRPDITKAKQMLGWEPRITLDEGLSKTIEWFRES